MAETSNPKNSFFLFCSEHRANLFKQHTSASNSTISSLLGKMWRDLDYDEKQKYVRRSEELRKVSISVFVFIRNYYKLTNNLLRNLREKIQRTLEHQQKQKDINHLSKLNQIQIQERRKENPKKQKQQKKSQKKISPILMYIQKECIQNLMKPPSQKMIKDKYKT